MYSLNEKLRKQKIITDKFALDFKKSNILYESGRAIATCCDHITFNANEHGEPKIKKIFFCRQKYCPVCSKRKSLKAYAIGMQLYEKLHNKYEFLHLVLTIKNCSAEDLRATIQTLFKKSSALFNLKQCNCFKGVLRCLEISYNEQNGSMHPHLHCLLCVNKSYFTSRSYLKIDTLRQLWAGLIGQTFASVYLTRVKEPEKAIAEICKYCVKPLENKNDNFIWVYEKLYTQTKSIRHIQSYGVIRDTLRELRLDFEKYDDVIEYELDDFNDIDDIKAWEEVTYTYDKKTKRYILHERFIAQN